ncbi:MAG: hypothetical protein U0Q22_06520, partial [Acidimicrobiales bacterium]
VYESNEALAASWEAQKQAEKSRGSVMDGIPAELPALLSALKVAKKAAASGRGATVPDVVEGLGIDELGPEATGDLLLGIAESARRAGIDPEDELRRAAVRFRERFDADFPR